jgi:hypothetical protein
MKRVLLTLLAVAVFITASVAWENHVSGHVEILIRLVDGAIEALDKGDDFAACGQRLDEVSCQWAHVHDSWELLIAHTKLTDIEEQMISAQWAAKKNNKEETLVHLGSLRLQLEHLGDSYSLSWSNLL